jgi:hypothetical protein
VRRGRVRRAAPRRYRAVWKAGTGNCARPRDAVTTAEPPPCDPLFSCRSAGRRGNMRDMDSIKSHNQVASWLARGARRCLRGNRRSPVHRNVIDEGSNVPAHRNVIDEGSTAPTFHSHDRRRAALDGDGGAPGVQHWGRRQVSPCGQVCHIVLAQSVACLLPPPARGSGHCRVALQCKLVARRRSLPAREFRWAAGTWSAGGGRREWSLPKRRGAASPPASPVWAGINSTPFHAPSRAGWAAARAVPSVETASRHLWNTSHLPTWRRQRLCDTGCLRHPPPSPWGRSRRL